MTRPFAMVARALLTVLALTIAAQVNAQPIFDHSECYKIKDTQPKKKYTADLLPEQTMFLAQTGCQVKVPAKLFCIDVEKSNVVPPPPGNVSGQNTRDYLCYKLKCPKLDMPLNVEDQFGTRTITIKKPGYLCAPARKVGFPDPPTPTPCLPPSTPVPTLTPGPTCNDLMQNGNETDVDCGGGICPPCQLGDGCLTPADCASGGCAGGSCSICTPGQQQGCGTMLPGNCSMGIRTCDMMGNYGPCIPSNPMAETCNSQDDDCNSVIDDGLGSTSCGTGACQNTVQNCVGGMSQTCTPGMSNPETCNGIDDDCDGNVDEGNPCPMVPNAFGTCAGNMCTYACNMGFADCNVTMVDGCEVGTQTDSQNCGGCNLVCTMPNPTCTAGVCGP